MARITMVIDIVCMLGAFETQTLKIIKVQLLCPRSPAGNRLHSNDDHANRDHILEDITRCNYLHSFGGYRECFLIAGMGKACTAKKCVMQGLSHQISAALVPRSHLPTCYRQPKSACPVKVA
jgi:hypothetical protein